MAQQRRDPEQSPPPEALLETARYRDFPRLCRGVRATISAANRTDQSGAVLTIRLAMPVAVDALDTAA
jgi:hypothetical protein